MTVHIEDVLLWSIAQSGDRYVFGAEASPAVGDPEKFDCSELVEWSCARAGVKPVMPDGAVNQYSHCRAHRTIISVGEAKFTRGALLFTGPGFAGGATGRKAIHHVGFSLGDGTTIEARGTKWGVGTWLIGNRFDFAARIPGVSYAAGHRPLPPPEEDFMAALSDDEQKELLTRVRDLHAAVTKDKDPNAVARQTLLRKVATKLGVTGV